MLLIAHGSLPGGESFANALAQSVHTRLADVKAVLQDSQGTVVVDASGVEYRELRRLVEDTPDFAQRWHVVLTGPLTRHTIHAARYLAGSGGQFDVQTGTDPGCLTRTRSADPRPFAAPSVLLRELCRASADDLRNDLVALVIIGARNGLRVGEFATCLGLAKRTLIFQFAKCGLSQPKIVKDWILALYATYLREHHRSGRKQVAAILQRNTGEIGRIVRRTIQQRGGDNASFDLTLHAADEAISCSHRRGSSNSGCPWEVDQCRA